MEVKQLVVGHIVTHISESGLSHGEYRILDRYIGIVVGSDSSLINGMLCEWVGTSGEKVTCAISNTAMGRMLSSTNTKVELPAYVGETRTEDPITIEDMIGGQP